MKKRSPSGKSSFQSLNIDALENYYHFSGKLFFHSETLVKKGVSFFMHPTDDCKQCKSTISINYFSKFGGKITALNTFLNLDFSAGFCEYMHSKSCLTVPTPCNVETLGTVSHTDGRCSEASVVLEGRKRIAAVFTFHSR